MKGFKQFFWIYRPNRNKKWLWNDFLKKSFQTNIVFNDWMVCEKLYHWKNLYA